MKLVVFALVAYAIYFFFFKKPNLQRESKEDDSETMVECEKCHTYIAIDESVKVNGKYFCSNECARLE